MSKVIAVYVKLGLFTSSYTVFYIYPHFTSELDEERQKIMWRDI